MKTFFCFLIYEIKQKISFNANKFTKNKNKNRKVKISDHKTGINQQFLTQLSFFYKTFMHVGIQNYIKIIINYASHLNFLII